MLMNTYNRYGVTFVKGEGSHLFDDCGKSYLDFASGIGVNSIGYANPKWVKAVSDQAGLLAHTSNLYHTLPAKKLAIKLAALSGLECVFFSNSGAEANEGMIKLARKYSKDAHGEGRSAILTLNNSFHGRTVTTLAATGQNAFHKNFDPFTPGFLHADAGDLDAVKNAEGICAVLIEIVQGEGGVVPLPAEYVREVAKICAERDLLLLIDEVQTGIGRTGSWFAFQEYGISPDVVSFAKGIAGGLPLGGFIANKKCSEVLKPGDHAATFGGNPISCAAALATLEIIEEALPGVKKKGATLLEGLGKINGLSGARGAGLMLGASVCQATHQSVRALVDKLLASGLVCLTAGNETLRLMPPLTITEDEINEGLNIMERCCAN
ncbi:MAG: acetylornithine/succinylornithine family transaminase [Defluviitaleaceae bacterium]|nr:acetylornithine/succinylornithine family transaminase [Defluviitaleaceae bacterium]